MATGLGWFAGGGRWGRRGHRAGCEAQEPSSSTPTKAGRPRRAWGASATRCVSGRLWGSRRWHAFGGSGRGRGGRATGAGATPFTAGRAGVLIHGCRPPPAARAAPGAVGNSVRQRPNARLGRKRCSTDQRPSSLTHLQPWLAWDQCCPCKRAPHLPSCSPTCHLAHPRAPGLPYPPCSRSSSAPGLLRSSRSPSPLLRCYCR